MKELRGKPESPGMSKLETARVASDLLASFLLGHWGRGRKQYSTMQHTATLGL